MQIAIGLYPGYAALDWVGPYQVLTSWPGAEVVLCAAEPGLVADDQGLHRVEVTHTFDDVASPDILLVPGGTGTRTIATNGGPIVDWIQAAHPTTQITTSVCTGALLLGAAGLLDGLRATTHWAAYDLLAMFGAEPTEQRVVFEDDARIVTAAGVSAGIDLALELVGRIAGPEVAQAIQLGIEYDPQPPFDTGAPSKAPAAIRELVESVIAGAGS